MGLSTRARCCQIPLVKSSDPFFSFSFPLQSFLSFLGGGGGGGGVCDQVTGWVYMATVGDGVACLALGCAPGDAGFGKGFGFGFMGSKCIH